jgi:hypothetical protein
MASSVALFRFRGGQALKPGQRFSVSSIRRIYVAITKLALAKPGGPGRMRARPRGIDRTRPMGVPLTPSPLVSCQTPTSNKVLSHKPRPHASYPRLALHCFHSVSQVLVQVSPQPGLPLGRGWPNSPAPCSVGLTGTEEIGN